MEKRKYRFALSPLAFAFLGLSFIVPAPSIMWGISIAISIFLSIVSTVNAIKFLKEQK